MDALTLLVVAATVLFLYWLSQLYYMLRWGGIPFIMPIPFVGSMRVIDMLSMDTQKLTIKYYQKYGRIHGQLNGSCLTLTVGDPELAQLITTKDAHKFINRRVYPGIVRVEQRMLFASKDNDWKRIRSTITQAFSSGKMKQMFSLINECAISLVRYVLEHARMKKMINVKSVVGCFTADVICSTSLSARVDFYKNPNHPIVANARKLFSDESNRYIAPIAMVFPKLSDFILRKLDLTSSFNAASFQNWTTEVMDLRQRQKKLGGNPRVDFLDLIIEAQENLDIGNEISTRNNSEKIHVTNKLTEEETIAQCVQFFTVGFIPMAAAISFALHHLATSQSHQDTLYREVVERVKKTNGHVTYDVVNGIPYLKAFVSETLRIHPGASFIEREASDDYELGNTGISISKGTCVLIPIAGMHQDPKFFPDPDQFIPERFLPVNRSCFNSKAYIPFGAGPRSCIAERFSRIVAKAALVHLIRYFRFFYPQTTKTKVELCKGQVNLQPIDFYLAVEERLPEETEQIWQREKSNSL